MVSRLPQDGFNDNERGNNDGTKHKKKIGGLVPYVYHKIARHLFGHFLTLEYELIRISTFSRILLETHQRLMTANVRIRRRIDLPL